MRGAVAILACAGLTTGCASEVEPPERVLPTLDCTDAAPLTVGRCIDAMSGAGCTGAEGEVPAFVELADGDPIRVVSGPQGSSMFVVAVRTMGIDPGDMDQPLGPRSPLVEIVVHDEDGAQMSLLRRRAAFAPDPAIDGMFFNAGFFVVVDDRCPGGHRLTADVALTDANDARRCGTLVFTADCSR